jgi:hypothetical protein
MIDVLSIGTFGRGSKRAVSFKVEMEVGVKVLDITFLSIINPLASFSLNRTWYLNKAEHNFFAVDIF